MNTTSTPQLVRRVTGSQAKEDRRRLAVQRVLEGESQVDVAQSLKVSVRSVHNWMFWYRNQGEEGLKLRPHPGGESKLSQGQADQVRDWLTKDATTFGFRTNLWTSPRIVKLIRERFGIVYNANYFCRWLHRNQFSLQKPAKRATQRDEARIASWTKNDWPRIVKKGNPRMPISF